MNFLEKLLSWLFKPNKNYIDEIHKIEINSDGFSVDFISSQKTNKYLWKYIEDIISHNDKVEIVMHKKIVQVLTSSYSLNYYYFLQKVPEGYDSFDYSFIDNFLNQLKGCECCGLMAMNENKCLSCGFEKWNNSLQDDYDSEEEYKREHQFELFKPYDDEEIDIHNYPEQGFKSDKSWIPIISEEDYKERF